MYSIDESGLESHREQIVHCRSDESIVASSPAMTNWFNKLLVWDVAFAPNQSMTFGMNDMLFEGIFGWGKHCC